MKKEKWLLKEIKKWKDSEIISPDTADVLMQKYKPVQSFNTMVVIFSVIGALLIGTGVILIGAKNWYNLHLYLRVFISVAPLLLAQLFAVYTIKCKFKSTAFRETSALILSLTVFSAVAMVGQTFHIAGDFGTYLLTCGLLFLPVIFIMDAVSPLIIYYYCILNWSALCKTDTLTSAALVILIFIGFLYVFLKRKNTDAKFDYMIYISLISGFAAVWILSWINSGSLLLGLLTYSVMLFSISGLNEEIELPFNITASFGGLVVLFVMTYQRMWQYADSLDSLFFISMLSIFILISLYSSFITSKRDKLKTVCLLLLLALCILRGLWQICSLDFWPYDFIFMIITNIILGFIGVGIIVIGTRKMSLPVINTGLFITCLLIILRFFDSDMDFLWRGLVFLALGSGMLLFNLRIIKSKKQGVTQ